MVIHLPDRNSATSTVAALKELGRYRFAGELGVVFQQVEAANRLLGVSQRPTVLSTRIDKPLNHRQHKCPATTRWFDATLVARSVSGE